MIVGGTNVAPDKDFESMEDVRCAGSIVDEQKWCFAGPAEVA